MASSDHEGYGAAFAVSEYASLAETSLFSEKFETRQRIFHVVESGGIGCIAGRLADSAVVVSERGNTVACKVVCDDHERLVAEDLLVAVLLPAARDHQYCWSRASCFETLRQGQCAVKYGIAVRVGERHLLGSVWIRRLRVLRPARLAFTGGQCQIETVSGLLEYAGYKPAFHGRFVCHAECRDVDGYLTVVRDACVGGNALDTLIGAVHAAYGVAVCVLVEMEYKAQFVCTSFERAFPTARRRLGENVDGDSRDKDRDKDCR